jgi:release factor glutamine methyltransferase
VISFSAFPDASMTVLEILKKTESFFRAKRIDDPRLSAELLLCHVLQCKRIDLYLNYDKPLTLPEVDRYREGVRRRAAREPLQYITGEGAFMGLALKVGPGVLIPRPETETLMESLLKDVTDLSGKRLLDMGTGPGTLAIYAKKRFPECEVIACDASPEALKIAEENGRLLGVSVKWVLSDMFENLQGDIFDIILSNPPYVKSADLEGLQEEVHRFEPRLALDGGPDGLTFYRSFLPQATAHLSPGGRVYLEVGEGQAGDVAELGRCAGLTLDRVERDLAGKERVVVSLKP